jgi:hypothetical protein
MAYAAHGQNTLAPRLEETRFWGRAIRVIAGGECRERERRKAARRPQATRAALCADMDGMRLSALRFPLRSPEAAYFFVVVVVSNTRAHESAARTIWFVRPCSQRGQDGDAHATKAECAGLALSAADDAQAMERIAVSRPPRLCGAGTMYAVGILARLRQMRAAAARAAASCRVRVTGSASR